MATLNWPGFGITSISPTLDQPSQSNANAWTGTRTVISEPWHGKWSFKVSLATMQGDAAFQQVRAFFTSLEGQVNTFHLPAVEAAQNANTGVTLSANAAQGATSIALTGVTTALVAGNLVTLNGQLLSLTSVGSLSGSAQTVNFRPTLRAAATSTTAVETAKPYALVYSDSSFSWDIGQWRRYGLTFNATEAVGESDDADPLLDVWTGGVGSGGGASPLFSFPELTSFISRSLLAAVVSPADKQVAYLTEVGREGEFVFSTANLSALVTADTAQGIYVAPSSDTTGASGAWVRKFSGQVSVRWFGATGDGTTDDSAAFVGAIALLKTFALNTGGGGFYKGSPELFIPAGHYYLGTTTLDINHTLIVSGEGSGQFGPQAGGCSHLRWAAATDGIRVQGPNTSGNTTVDITTHDGAGGVVLRDLCLEGGFAGTESDHHGLVLRQAVKAENLYIKNWPGEGVKALAGNQTGGGTVGGNLSTTLLVGIKTEGNRGGIDIRGADANVITTINCEGYQNRWFGLLDDNGAGSNTHIGWHCASNGVVSGTWPQTQCSYSGNRYALKWGGDPTVAPSGTTADTANWLYIEAGAAITNLIPAWVSTANTFRAGGDYLTLNSASAHFLNCYSEGGGFSQFSAGTIIDDGTIGEQYFRGGSRIFSANDGLHLVTTAGDMWLDSRGGETGLWVRDQNGTTFGYIDFLKTGGVYINGNDGVHLRKGGATVVTVDDTQINMASGVALLANGTQVVSTRKTGTAANATDLATALTLVNDLKTKLIAHGLIS